MSIDPNKFSSEIERATTLALAQQSGKAEVVTQEERLREGQVYLSVSEVFSTELVDNAFTSPDGVDLRGPLVLHNLKNAVNLCNWLDTDTVLRTCWALNPQLPNELQQVAEMPVKDRAFLQSVWGRLAAENPPAQSAEEIRARYENAQVRRAVSDSGMPANSWLLPASQIALRIWFITRIARDYTAGELKLDEVWYMTANEKAPLSRKDFARVFQVDLSGIGRAERAWMGVGGNFFTDLGRSISKLFRHPLKFFKSAVKEFGRGLMLLGKPLEWLEKLPYGHLLAGLASGGLLGYLMQKLHVEWGRVLNETGDATRLFAGLPAAFTHDSFKEQDLARDFANLTWQVGSVAVLIGAVIGAIPCGVCQGIGAAVAAIGALMVAIGQGWLAIMEAMVQHRLAEAMAGIPLPVPPMPPQDANAASNAAAAAGAHSDSGGSGGGAIGALVLLFALGK